MYGLGRAQDPTLKGYEFHGYPMEGAMHPVHDSQDVAYAHQMGQAWDTTLGS